MKLDISDRLAVDDWGLLLLVFPASLQPKLADKILVSLSGK